MAGQEVVVPPDEAETPQVTDLMTALRKSLDQAKAKATGAAPPRPKRLTKPSTAVKRAAAAKAPAARNRRRA